MINLLNQVFSELTSTIESIFIQMVSYSTAAGEATDSVGTNLFTTSIGNITLIDVWKQKAKRIIIEQSRFV